MPYDLLSETFKMDANMFTDDVAMMGLLMPDALGIHVALHFCCQPFDLQSPMPISSVTFHFTSHSNLTQLKITLCSQYRAMSTATYSPPVYSMHYDLLLDIFEMNADMFSDSRALNTARFTSHVCRSWRNIILTTPSIWAKLIDLDCGSHLPHNIWRDELIRRSGTSLLWIKAKTLQDIVPPPHLVNFLFDVIIQHWGRIQKIVAKVYCRDVHPTQYAPLLLPAPHLETFEFGFCGSISMRLFTPQDPAHVTLFSGQAPMLRRFDFERHRPDSSAPWLHQLHFINLTWGYTTLSVLSATHYLQELKIRWTDDTHMVLSLPPVALPNLNRLSISLIDLPQVACILDHLEIPRGCSLDIYADSDLTEHHNFWPAVNTISQATLRYFQSHSPSKLLFEYTKDSLILKDSTHGDAFSLSILFFEGLLFPPRPTRHFLAKLPVAEFSGVKELALRIGDLPPLSFLSFISCFPLVETIRASEQDLEYLTSVQGLDDPESVQGGCKNIFPCLTTVFLTTARRYKPHNIGKVTTDFTLSRIKNGQPLSVLDLTEAIYVEPTALDLLRDITGLEVLLKDEVDLISL